MLHHRIALLLTIMTFALILLGGIVHNTGSSLACPDWPLCYGSLFPEMKGGVAIEHSHRLLAATIGLMTIFLTLLIRKRDDRSLRHLGQAALLLVILQGLLGGLTVLYRLPTLVSTAHLGTSLLFFSVLVLIAWKTSDLNPPIPRNSFLIKLTGAIVFLQMILGALVRHTGSGLICPDIPFCYGSLWPPTHAMQLQMAHRLGAVVVTILMAVTLLSHWRVSARVRHLLTFAFLLVLVQIGLGVLSVTTLLGLSAVTAHLGVATLLMGTLVSLSEIS